LVTGTDGPDAPKAGIVQIATGLLTECSVIPHNSGPVVAIAPGGARNVLRDDALRRWPAENYADLTKRLLTDGIQVVLTGSPSDDWVRERFRHLPIIDLVGKTTLIELIAIYRACDLVITHDSGPMHLAAAAGARVVAVFGPTNPNEKVLVGGGIRVLWGGERLACRPCYDGRNYADCHDNRCLKEITVGAVYEEVAKILKQR
jgi:heptosyltransferase-2